MTSSQATLDLPMSFLVGDEKMGLQKTFIIKPNMNCNLRCGYCYEFNKNGECYSNALLDVGAITSFIERTARVFPDSRVLWLLHGGEPLVSGVRFLEQFISKVRRVREERHVDFQLALQTNGTLVSDEVVRALEDNIDLLSERVVSVSIDGPRKMNDLVRKSINGASSFDAVMSGIERIKKSKLDFSTITVVGAHNVEHADEVYAFMKSIGARLCKFIPCYNFDGDGCSERFGISPIDYARFVCRIFDCWMKDLPCIPKDRWLVIDPIATILAKVSRVFVTWCEFRDEKCDNFVCLYPDGELWLCDTMDHSTMRDVGYIGNIKTLSDADFVKAVSSPCSVCGFHEFYEQMLTGCRECDIYGMCHGGCLPMRDIIQKKSHRLFEEYCKAKHMLFDYIKKAADYALS